MLADLRLAVRQLRKSPAFAATAILTLGLGIGVNTAVFSVVNAVLLRPLPFADPDQLMVIWLRNDREQIEKDITSFPTFTDWQQGSQRFARMAAYTPTSPTLTGRGDPAQLPGAIVSEGFFETLGVAPARGRRFEPGDHTGSSELPVIISDGLWHQRFGGGDVLGQILELNGVSRTIVGVMPASFDFPADTAFWTAMAPVGDLAQLLTRRGALWLSVIGRLQEGVTQEAAQAEMDTIAARLAAEYPDAEAGRGILLEPLHASIVGDTRPAVLILFGAVTLVLLIACANLANLLLARAAARRREAAVRQALGAGRMRLVRQVIAESLVLGAIGGAAGLLLAGWSLDALVALAPERLPRIADARLDLTVLAFTAGLSILTALVFGLVPALDLSRRAEASDLKEGGRSTTESPRAARVRSAFVVAEIAVALMLLAGAGLLMRTMWSLGQVDIGLHTERLVTGRVQVPPPRYASGEPVAQFYETLTTRLRADARVAGAGAVGSLFLSRLPNQAVMYAEGRPTPPPGAVVPPVPIDAATPEFFGAAGLRLVDGRLFTTDDRDGREAVTVVNEALAGRYFPGEAAVGRRVTFDSPTADNIQWLRIVGVVSDARRFSPDQEPRPELYVPHAQMRARGMTIVVRASEGVGAASAALREHLAAVDPNLPVTIRTGQEFLSEQLATRRFLLTLLGLFAALAVALALLGTYGVVSYATLRRTGEFGVRLALGAQPQQILAMVIGQAFWLAAAGVVLGLAGGLVAAGAIRSFLYGVPAFDVFTYAAAATLMLLAALAAAWLPARRATRIDPTTALRSE
jgi:putative ABC transport system permease protein